MTVCGVSGAALVGMTERGAADHLAGRAALRHAYGRFRARRPDLPRHTSVEYRSSGAPVIVASPGLFCSVSHCRGTAVAVVGDRPLGIDIECARSHDARLLRIIASTDEIASVEGRVGNAAEIVTLLWTLKEAAAKAAGVGIDGILRGLPVRPHSSGGFVVGPWIATSYRVGGFFVALAFQDSAGHVPRICWHQPARLSPSAPI